MVGNLLSAQLFYTASCSSYKIPNAFMSCSIIKYLRFTIHSVQHYFYKKQVIIFWICTTNIVLYDDNSICITQKIKTIFSNAYTVFAIYQIYK